MIVVVFYNSFQVLENGQWAYINQTKNHARIYFFDSDAKNDSGSFVLIPLKVGVNFYPGKSVAKVGSLL